MACGAGAVWLAVAAAAAAVASASPLPADVPCSEQEHECLSLGRLLNPKDGQCYPAGRFNSCQDPSLSFQANRSVALGGGGLHGECEAAPCMYTDVFAASTGRCETFEDFQKACGGGAQLSGFKNAFGEAVCDPRADPPAFAPLPPSPPQPPYAGRCRPPPWMVPAPAPTYVNRLAGIDTPCSARELSCYMQGQVLRNGSCWALRERGPCAEGEWLVLDEAQLPLNEAGYVVAERARVEAVCRKRPCAQGLVLQAAGGAAGGAAGAAAGARACVRPSDLRRRFCGRELPALDVFGVAGCVGFPLRSKAAWAELPKAGAPGRCTLMHSTSYSGYGAVQEVGGAPCARTDGGDCAARALEAKASFILYSEDD